MTFMRTRLQIALLIVVTPPLAMADAAAHVERVFRAEIYGRGDANVRPQQPIDKAGWI